MSQLSIMKLLDMEPLSHVKWDYLYFETFTYATSICVMCTSDLKNKTDLAYVAMCNAH